MSMAPMPERKPASESPVLMRNALRALLGEMTAVMALPLRVQHILRATGARNGEELLSVLWNFPTLAEKGLDFPAISNFLVQHDASLQQVISAIRSLIRRYTLRRRAQSWPLCASASI